MRSKIVRRININLTDEDEMHMNILKKAYAERYGKTTEADIIRDAIEAYTKNKMWDRYERKYPVYIKDELIY